jgi:hypothetical protein
MNKHRNKIIAAVVALCVLAGAWVFGGNYSRAKPDQLTVDNGQLTIKDAPPTSDTPATETPPPASDAPAAETPSPPPESSATPTAEPTAEPTQDKYQTDPVPSGKPTPVEPQDAVQGDGSFTVTLSVRCDTILNNMNLLNKEKHELVPDDGVIFATATVTVYEGESAFNVLRRELKRAKIHMEFMNTPIYNSAYIEGINNLYEFDVGELSGWMYAVNGWYPNYGCSRYQLKPGDVIEWNYTCDLGRDLGEFWLGGQQNAG